MDVLKFKQGSISSMRVMMFICIIVALGISIAAVTMWACCDKQLSEVTGLVSAILGSSFVGKAVQSFSENKTLSTESEPVMDGPK